MWKLWAVIAGLGGGCVGDSGIEFGESEQHAETANKLAGNKLAGNQLAANKLAGNGLSAASTDLAAMIANEDGREVLGYLMSCALKAGTQLISGDHVFPGQVGVAHGWLDKPLTDEERRWVSACVLARVNAFGVSVQLSMRGKSGALSTTNTERATHTLFEGGFWGDVFGTGGMHACTSRYKSTDPQVSTMPLRACTVDDGTGVTMCGFEYEGICEDICSKTFEACGGEQQIITTFLAAP